jgi:hypothetical protein
MRKPTRRAAVVATAAAGAAVALGVGGFAYAAGGDPATPDHGYVVVEDGPDTGQSSEDGRDCPEKNQGDQPGGESQNPESQNPESQSPESQTPSQTDPHGQA